MTGGRQPPAGPGPSRVHQLAATPRPLLIARWLALHPHSTLQVRDAVCLTWSNEHLIASILDVIDYERSAHDSPADG